MTEQQVTTKEALMVGIERAWLSLTAILDQLTEAQMTTLRNVQGWTVKDHINHLKAWEQSVVFLLQGKPRHEGLGIAEALYLTGDEDKINAGIFEKYKDLPLADVLAQFYDTHQMLLQALQPLTDLDLQKPYRHYLPNEPGDGDGPSAITVIYSNSAQHFTEHLSWIESLVDEAF